MVQEIQNRSLFYKLDENKNVVPSSLGEWANFIESKLPSNYWIVGKDIINEYLVSTVFIGLCHNYNPHSNIPIVFETIVFNDHHEIYCDRYSTWKQAEQGHMRASKWVKNGCKEDE